MSMIIVFYTVIPQLTNLPIVTIGYLTIFATLGIVFPSVMEALTSLNASIRGTISSLANSTMNSANTLGAWIAGLIYVQFGGYSSIGIFSAVCLALSLGIFLFGGVLGGKAARIGQESASS
jgi:predicted MFS family arabinose efflux permease